MKKLLSIICTLAIVLSVVLVPGMFSTSAASVDLPFDVVSTTLTEQDGAYYVTGGWKDHTFYTNFEMEAGKTYNLFMNSSIDNYSACGIYLVAISDPAASPVQSANKTKVVHAKGLKNINNDIISYNFNADDFITEDCKYLGLIVNCAEGNTTKNGIKNVAIREVPSNEGYANVRATYEHGYWGVDEEGVCAFMASKDYGWQIGQYDVEINPDKYYKIEYEFKGKNGVDGGKTLRWGTSPDGAPLTLGSVSVTHPVGNVAINNYTAYTVIANGSALGATAESKYLTFYGQNVVAGNTYVRKVKVTEIEKPFFTAYGGVTNMYTDENGVNEYGIPANDTLGSGWGADNYMTSDFVLEANSAYLVNYEWKGHNYDTPLYFAITNSPNAGFKANYKTPATKTTNKTSYSPHGAIFYTGDKVTDEYKYFGMCVRDFGGDPYLVKNIKIEKIDLANAGTLIPSAQSKNAFVQKDANGAYELYCNAWCDDGAFTFDYVIDPEKTYKMTFDFKGANRPGDAGGDAANKWALKTHTSTGAVAFAKGTGKIIDTIPEKDNQWGYFSYEFTFKGSDIGATAESKYLVLQQGYYYTKCYFKNVKIEEVGATVTPGDYTAVDSAIEAANALNKDNYKDFSAVDSAIAAVVTGKGADEQAAIDAMAKAINDAVAALELKGANYAAVDAAIAAANALNKADYEDFSAVDAAIAAVVRDKNITEQAEVDAMAKAITDAIDALVEVEDDDDVIDDGYLHPVLLGSDLKAPTVENGETIYTFPCNYGEKQSHYYDFELEAGAFYKVSFDYKGDGKGKTGMSFFATADPSTVDKTLLISTVTNKVRAKAIPYIDATADTYADYYRYNAILRADDIIAEGKNHFALNVNFTDNGAGYFKNLTIEKISLGEYMYPAMTGVYTAEYVDADNNAVWGNFGSTLTNSGIKPDYGQAYVGFWAMYDVTVEAGKQYKISYEYMGHNYSDSGKGFKWGVVDPTVATPGAEHVTGTFNVAAGVPSSKTSWTAASTIVSGDELLAGATAGQNKLALYAAAVVYGANFRKVTIEEFVIDPQYDYPIKIGARTSRVRAEDTYEYAANAEYVGMMLVFDQEIKADKEYTLTYEFKGHNYTIGHGLRIFAVDAATVGTSEHPAATAYNADKYVTLTYGSSKGKWTAYTTTFKGSDILDDSKAAFKTLMIYGKGFETGGYRPTIRKMKIVESDVTAVEPGDYAAVDAAIAAANALVKENYKNFAAVDSAIAAVVTGKGADEQVAIDAMAKAINDAIAALELKGANYAAVDAAKAAANALDKNNYKDFSAVEAAIAAVVTGKDITKQAEVDAMAKAINDAVAALELKDADYSAVDAAKAAANAIDKNNYKDFSAVEAAIAAVVTGKDITKQAEVDAMAKAINDAVAALKLKDADYSAVDAAIAAAEALDADDYTNYDAVEAAIAAVVTGKDITKQAEVDAYAKAINDAVAALIEKADYSVIADVVEKYEDELGEESDYTEESVVALKAVLDKIAANNNLPADKQEDVDALAEELEAAIKALVKKEVVDGGNTGEDDKEDDKTEDKVEDNETDKEIDKTGDNSNIFVAIAALVVSVLGMAVLAIAKKRRA